MSFNKTVNHKAFDDFSPERDYWVGMLMADGCIKDRGHWQPYVCLSLHQNDINHVELFRKYLGSTHKINVDRRGTCTLSIASKHMADTLLSFGVGARKSFTARVINLESSASFWRGVSDGDGSLFIKTNTSGHTYPRYTLVGSKIMCEQFGNFISSQQADINVAIVPHGTIWRAQVSKTSTVVATIKCLYRDDGISLSRKQLIANKILAQWG